MNRRDFVSVGVLAGASLSVGASAAQADKQERVPVIDAHCHAGRGLNYGKDEATSDPWTTYNDPQWTLRRMDEAGIARSIIFPISNVTYENANEEIASYVRRWPERLIGFAKHDAKTEAGKIRAMLRREVRQLGLRGLKLHGVPSQEMVEAAAELRIPILFHPGAVKDSLEVVRANPQVSFILAHLPGEKLIFGSDGPLVDSRVELHKIRLLRLPPQKEALVLGGNIRRLLGT
jgi:hypothetical protein